MRPTPLSGQKGLVGRQQLTCQTRKTLYSKGAQEAAGSPLTGLPQVPGATCQVPPPPALPIFSRRWGSSFWALAPGAT